MSWRPFYQDVRNCRVPGAFSKELVESALDYQAKDDDVILSTFPKCGTTWSQMILVLILHKGKRVVNSFQDLYAYSPFMEMCGSKEVETAMLKPGVIKIHFSYELTPYNPQAKYIYVARNPRDACVSFFHHTRTPLYDFADGTFEEYFEIFINGQNEYGDYFDHTLSWWEHRHDPNVLFITFEEMKADIKGTIKRFARFLGPEYEESVEDEEVMKNILECSSLEYMRKTINPGIEGIFQLNMPEGDNLPEWMNEIGKNIDLLKKRNPAKGSHEFSFIRKGQVGDWKNYFSEEQINRLNQKFTEKFKGKDVEDLLALWREHGCIDY